MVVHGSRKAFYYQFIFLSIISTSNLKVFLIKLHLVEMNKKDFSEADIKAKFITPSILKSGWDELTQIGREIYFTDGRILNLFLCLQ